MIYDDVLNKIIWSYSSVNSYDNCPKCFKLERIDRVSKIQNAFAEWGSFMHSILEAYFKDEADLFDLLELYEKGYTKNVTHQFPYNRYADLGERYYNAGIAYFNNFNGLSKNYEVLEVECQTPMEIGGRPFIGFIDLVLRDKRDGSLQIVDHKSKSGFKSDAELAQYLRQLYLYAEYVRIQYGDYPKCLFFNMVRAGKVIKTEFDQRELQKSIDWFNRTIEKIYADEKFEDKIAIEYDHKFKDINTYKPGNDFFCANLCGAREHCSRSGCMNSNRVCPTKMGRRL